MHRENLQFREKIGRPKKTVAGKLAHFEPISNPTEEGSEAGNLDNSCQVKGTTQEENEGEAVCV